MNSLAHTTAEARPGAAAPARAATHVPALDGARGIAILLVLACHFANSLIALGPSNAMLQAGRLGWCGVDVFFALSGFLITGILLDTKARPYYFRNFYARRVLRIMPLYYGALAVVAALTLLLPGAGLWGGEWSLFGPASLLWPGLFLQNAAILLKGPEVTGILTHYWSLAVEEHFYLVWPLLVWLARSPRQVLAMALAAIVLSVAGRWLTAAQGAPIAYVFALTPLRLDGLAIGAAAAVLIRGERRALCMRWAPLVLALAGAAFVALVVGRRAVEQDDAQMWLWAYPLVALCTASALVAGCAGGRIARALSAAPLRWFGRYSYGLYVWHPIVNMMLFHSRLSIVPADAGAAELYLIVAAVFALNLLIAWVSFNLWEKFFLDLKRYFAPEPARRPAPAAAAVGELDAPFGEIAPAVRPS